MTDSVRATGVTIAEPLRRRLSPSATTTPMPTDVFVPGPNNTQTASPLARTAEVQSEDKSLRPPALVANAGSDNRPATLGTLTRLGLALRSLLGGPTEARLQADLRSINALAGELAELRAPADFQTRTAQLKARLAAGESLESLRVEAYAVARQAALITTGKRPFDCQVLGALAMDSGHIAEMKTGEGKTLTAVMPLYLNALAGKGAHLVTVNDTLAQRDRDEMAPIFEMLGLSCGCVLEQMTPEQRRAGYAADVTYTTDRNLGFDYLRDRTARKVESRVQREPFFALVDEVDEVLLDEARTPLIVSGNPRPASSDYRLFNELVVGLRPGDHYLVDREAQTVWLTDEGSREMESRFHKSQPSSGGLYAERNLPRYRYLQAALKAHYLLKRDIDYLVTEKGVEIVDENKGRTSEGRRYNEGLHQALEAKEGVPLGEEQTTVASITYPNLFKRYPRLAGMSGTAKSSEGELMDLYALDVVPIPTNKPVIREDLPDLMFATLDEKYAAVAKQSAEDFFAGRPVLVGTLSVEHNRYVAQALVKAGVPPEAIQILNAASVRGDKTEENRILGNAGRSGVITVATNMAGRGADIKPDLINFQQLSVAMRQAASAGESVSVELPTKRDAEWLAQWLDGENPKLESLGEGDAMRVSLGGGTARALRAADFPTGGLTVYGTARGASARVDDQLIGRAGRQGAPGRSRFFLSLEDDLFRSLEPAAKETLRTKIGKAGGAVSGGLARKTRRKAQQLAEGKAFGLRERTQKHDRVLDSQRQEFFAFRDGLLGLGGVSIRSELAALVSGAIKTEMSEALADKQRPTLSQVREASARVAERLGIPVDLPCLRPDAKIAEAYRVRASQLENEIDESVRQLAESTLTRLEKTTPNADAALRKELLAIADVSWSEHLEAMEGLGEVIVWQALAQKDPDLEYTLKAFNIFQETVADIRYRVAGKLFPFLLSSAREASEIAAPR